VRIRAGGDEGGFDVSEETERAAELPPLPEPVAEARWWEQNAFNTRELSILRDHPEAEKYWGDRDKLKFYTADQMQAVQREAYELGCARAALASARPSVALRQETAAAVDRPLTFGHERAIADLLTPAELTRVMLALKEQRGEWSAIEDRDVLLAGAKWYSQQLAKAVAPANRRTEG
jgi:hypothetical protein